MLPMQLIYKEKANRSLPAVAFLARLVLMYKEKHCSNEKETLNIFQSILCSHIKDAKENVGLHVSEKFLLL